MNDTQMMNHIQNIILYQTKVKKNFCLFQKKLPPVRVAPGAEKPSCKQDEPLKHVYEYIFLHRYFFWAVGACPPD